MVRAAFYDKTGLKKGEWSSEEDERLGAYIQTYGHSNWRQLPKFAGLARCGKSCRLRWLNYLRPNLKYGDYTQAEEEIIIKLHQKLGNKWSTIAAYLPGRTDSEIKNHWHTTLKKRFQQNRVTNEVKASKPRDNEFNTGSDQSMLINGVLQVTLPATSQISDSTGFLSPLPYSSELSSDIHSHTTVTCNEKLVIEDDFTFLDAFIEPVNESFWTEPNVGDISYTPSDIVSGDCNGSFQSSDSIQILDVGALSHRQSPMEESLVPETESDFSSSFLNAETEEESTMDDFWTQPYVPDMCSTFHANYSQNNFL